MKKKSIVILAFLLFGLMLTGCGRTQEETDSEIMKDAVLMAVGEDTVSVQEAMAYLYFLKCQYEVGMGEEVWSYEISSGETLEDYAKEAVITNLTQLKTICQEAAAQEVTLDEEESYEAVQGAKQLLKGASKEDVARFGLTEEILTGVYKDNALASKFFDVATAEVDTNISDEEARQITIQYVAVLTEGMGKEQKKASEKRAKNLLSEAKKASSFLNFATNKSDSEEVELTFGRETMPEEFGEEAFALKTGEISSLVEGEKGYYILYCITDFDEDATLVRKENMIEEKRDRLFRSKYKEWSEKYKVVVSTTLWDEISFTQENAQLEQK